MKKCLYCAELIQDEAVKCKHCGSMVSGSAPTGNVPYQQQPQQHKNWLTSPSFGGIGKWLLILCLSPLAVYLWYISIPLFVFWYIWKKSKLNTKQKWIGTGIAIVVIIVLMVSSGVFNPKPVLSLTEPANGSLVVEKQVKIKGAVEPRDAKVEVNGELIPVQTDGSFFFDTELPNEKNEFEFKASKKVQSTKVTYILGRRFTDDEKKQRAEEAKQKQEAELQADKEKVREYYHKALQIDSNGSAASKQIQAQLESGNVLDLYSTASGAKPIIINTYMAYQRMKDEVVLINKDNEIKFKDGLNDLYEGYSNKNYGISELLDYLDNRELGKLNSAQTSFTVSQQYILSGTAKLVDVLRIYGLLDEIQK